MKKLNNAGEIDALLEEAGYTRCSSLSFDELCGTGFSRAEWDSKRFHRGNGHHPANWGDAGVEALAGEGWQALESWSSPARLKLLLQHVSHARARYHDQCDTITSVTRPKIGYQLKFASFVTCYARHRPLH